MTRRYRRDTLAYGAAMAVDRLSGFLLLPLLTRLLPVEQYGLWTQALVAAGMLTPILLLGFQTAMVQFFSATSPQDLVRRSVSLAMLSAVAALFALLALLAWLWPEGLAQAAFADPHERALILPLLGLLATEAGFELVVAQLRADGRVPLLSGHLAVKSLLRLALPVAVVGGLHGGVGEALAGVALTQALHLLLLGRTALPLASILAAGWAAGRSRWREVLGYSLPLVLLAALTMGHNFTDRFLLTHLLGLDQVARYAAAYSLMGVAAVFYAVPGFTLFPALAALRAEGREQDAAALFSRALYFFLFCALPSIAILAPAAPHLLPLLATREYRLDTEVLAPLGGAVLGFGLYQMFLYVVLLSGHRRLAPLAMAASLLVNLALNLVLAPRYGLAGAALAAALSNLLLAWLAGRAALRAMPGAMPWSAVLGLGLRAVVAFVVVALANREWNLAYPPALFAAMSLAAIAYLLPDLLRRRNPLQILRTPQ